MTSTIASTPLRPPPPSTSPRGRIPVVVVLLLLPQQPPAPQWGGYSPLLLTLLLLLLPLCPLPALLWGGTHFLAGIATAAAAVTATNPSTTATIFVGYGALGRGTSSIWPFPQHYMSPHLPRAMRVFS